MNEHQDAVLTPAEPSRPSRRMVVRWVLIIALVALATVAVVVLPTALHAATSTQQPTPLDLLAVGGSVSLCAIGLLGVGLWAQLKPAPAIILYGATYNVLIVIVKFSLGPWSLYAYNQTAPIDASVVGLFPYLAVGIFALYAAALLGLYAYYQHRVRLGLGIGRSSPIALLVVAGMLFAFGALFLVLLEVLRVTYVTILFLTPIGLTVGLALTAALVLARTAMARAADQAILVRNASLLTAFFWIGFLLLALYHVLWFVYLLILLSLWPLKTVTSK